MKIRPAFFCAAFFSGVFGLLLTFVPGFSASLFDIELNEGGLFITKIFGAALLGYSIIFWLIKDDSPSEARRNIILGDTVHSGIASIFWIVALFQGFGNLLILIPLLGHLGLAIWFGYLYLKGAK
jgi:hypothetical protein